MSNRYLGGFITNTPTQPTTTSAPGVWTLSQVSQAVGNSIWPPAGFFINNSLRFRSSASAYLNRTPGSAGSQTTWTWSGWIKRGLLGSTVYPLFTCYVDTTHYSVIDFSSDVIRVLINNGGTEQGKATTPVYRDPSSWYHIVVSASNSASQLNIYVNGVQVTAFSTNNTVTQSWLFNSTNAHWLGREQFGASNNYFDGYLADINFIDGQALTPSSFGQISTVTGVWQPKAYSGTYGTNGFKLNFSNGTSTTTLGYDSSGNSNNWTTNNISLTSGSTYDWMLDSPTPFAGSSYGVGNYCVMNPLANSAYNTLSEANLKVTGSGSWGNTRASFGLTSGKWYWEQAITSGTWGFPGISTAQAVLDTYDYPYTAYGWAYRSDNGNKYTANTQTAYGASFGVGDIIGVAFDAGAGSLTFYKNGTSQGVAFTGLTSGPYFPTVAGLSSVNVINFGQRPFAYTPPTGYKSLCTYNLPAASIVNGASYMAATTYTGTGASQSLSNAVNGVSFQPDLVWVKLRSLSYSHNLFDVNRGVLQSLRTDSTNAEFTYTSSLTSFNSNGFTTGSAADLNTSSATSVAWQWKAGGTAVTNTAGSITSQVSANTTAGFSVVTYTGTGANATVGHGLGVAPSFIITKNRAFATYWLAYHVSLGNTQYICPNATDAVATSAGAWNNTSPTSTVFSLGSTNPSNYNGNTQVAYCFAAIAGYSAFGSYTGNGSTDGPFVYCGFRPRFVMIKQTNTAANWVIMDSARNTYNEVNLSLQPNTSNAEESGFANEDFLSNGFKMRTTNATWNANGGTFIYAAFAENPFQNSLAR